MYLTAPLSILQKKRGVFRIFSFFGQKRPDSCLSFFGRQKGVYMEALKQWSKNPAFVFRCVISLFLVISLVCFFFPFATMMLNSDDLAVGVLDFVVEMFGGELPKPRHLSGIQLIFAFASGETIHKNLNIGPLPCNAYILTAFLAGIAALVLLWCSWKRHIFTLLSSLLSFVSAMSLIIFIPRFVGYYTAYTKNNGEAFGNLFADSHMVVQAEAALIVAIVFLFLAFMVTFMLHFSAKSDPFFRGE